MILTYLDRPLGQMAEMDLDDDVQRMLMELPDHEAGDGRTNLHNQRKNNHFHIWAIEIYGSQLYSTRSVGII